MDDQKMPHPHFLVNGENQLPQNGPLLETAQISYWYSQRWTYMFWKEHTCSGKKQCSFLERNKTRCSLQGWPLNEVTLEGKQPQFRAMGSSFRWAWGKFTHAIWFQQPRRINIYYPSYKTTRKKKSNLQSQSNHCSGCFSRSCFWNLSNWTEILGEMFRPWDNPSCLSIIWCKPAPALWSSQSRKASWAASHRCLCVKVWFEKPVSLPVVHKANPTVKRGLSLGWPGPAHPPQARCHSL